MLPLGAVLLVLAVLGGVVWLKAVMALAERLERVRNALHHGHVLDRAHREQDLSLIPGRAARAGSLWVLLAATQVVLYLVQENVESRLAGLRAPGLGAILGAHWAAVPIHLSVAAVLAVAASGLIRYRRRLAKAVAQHERAHAGLWARRVRPAPAVSAAPRPLTPHERWCSQRWQRPPPASIAA
jgi:hypothetical protein